MSQPIELKRRNPRQQRSQHTVKIILEAAAQILETRGEAYFTTNTIAERAGVSIGTLYQYFKDKDAILRQLSDREVLRLQAEIKSAAADTKIQSHDALARRLVRALIDFFSRRQRSKRIIMLNILLALSSNKPEERIKAAVDELTATLNEAGLNTLAADDVSIFVLIHSLLGVLRSAMIMRPDLLDSPELEERLVFIMLCFINKSDDLL